MKRVFVDANIVIDLLCERYPWFPKVLRIFSMGDLGQIELFCSSLLLGTASYIMETRKLSSQDIFDGIALLCKMCTPTTVDESVVKSALVSGLTDFEDVPPVLFSPNCRCRLHRDPQQEGLLCIRDSRL